MWIACVNIAFVRTTQLIWCTLLKRPITSADLGHGWELASGHCRPVRHTRPALPTHLPECELSEDSEEDESDEDTDDEEDNCVPRQCNDLSESSDTNSIDSTSDAECSTCTFNKVLCSLTSTIFTLSIAAIRSSEGYSMKLMPELES